MFGKKSKYSTTEFERLEARVAALEEENKKSAEAIKEISAYLGQVTVIVTTLAQDFAVVSEALQAKHEQDDILKKYLSPDDDDGYIH